MGNDCCSRCSRQPASDDGQKPRIRQKKDVSVIDSQGVPKQNAYRTYVKAPTSAGRQSYLVRRMEDADSIPDDIWLYDDNLNKIEQPSHNKVVVYGTPGRQHKNYRKTYEEVPRNKKKMAPGYGVSFLPSEKQQNSSTKFRHTHNPAVIYSDQRQNTPGKQSGKIYNPISAQHSPAQSQNNSVLGNNYTSPNTPNNTGTGFGGGPYVNRSEANYSISNNQPMHIPPGDNLYNGTVMGPSHPAAANSFQNGGMMRQAPPPGMHY